MKDLYLDGIVDENEEEIESLLGPVERQALKNILRTSNTDRITDDLQYVTNILQRIEFITKLEIKIQQQLSFIVRYEEFHPGAIICNQGDIGDKFYIIITGCLNVMKRKDDGDMEIVITLVPGQSFGELALKLKGGKRAATIISQTRTECLTIEGDEYRKYLKKLHDDELSRKIDLLSRQTIFKGWNKKELEKLASVMIIQKIPYNTVIVEQGGEADALYFILSGEVRVIRKINSGAVKKLTENPLFSARFGQAQKKDKFESLPDLIMQFPRSANSTPRSNYKITPYENEVEIEIMVLGPYSAFGEVAILKGVKRSASVIANSYTELLVLTRHDFLNNVKSSMRKRFDHSDAPKTNKEMILEINKALDWEKFKRSLVFDILLENNKEHYLLSHTTRFYNYKKKPLKWIP